MRWAASATSPRRSIDKKADYVLALKGNQGSLREDVELFVAEQKAAGFKDTKISRDQTVDGDHGRIETRTTTVIHDVAWLQKRHDWPGLKAVVMVESTREIAGKFEQETRFYITSLVLLAHLLGPIIRSHWAIENSLHWVMDMIFRDDECRVRTDHAPANFATIRHMAHNLIRNAPGKDSLRLKRKAAGWDDDFLADLIAVGFFTRFPCAADAMMDDEETFGIVFPLHSGKPRVVRAPMCALPVFLEKVQLGIIRSRVRCDAQKFIHGSIDVGGIATRDREVGLMATQVWQRCRAMGTSNGKGKSIDHLWVHRCIPCRRPGLVGCAGEPLVEVQRHPPMPRCRKQCIGKVFLLVRFEQRSRQPRRCQTVHELAGFRCVAGGPHVARWSARPIIRQNQFGQVRLQVCAVPVIPPRKT